VTRRGPNWSTGFVPTGPDDESLATLTPLRGIAFTRQTQSVSAVPQDEPALWFVTITVSGDRMSPEAVREGLERLSMEQPFLVSAGYAGSRAEVRYWDESTDVEGAVSQALRLWADHELSAGLPHWRVVGLEVVDRDTARRRWNSETAPSVMALGEIRPMDGGQEP